jgi:acetylornithine/succinyldiaminopimelate/putrescine aminotransferase
MSLAKGLAGGVPIGALLATDEAAKGLLPLPGEPVTHASTFGGNALACAASLCVLEVIEEDDLLSNCREAGDHLARGLQHLIERHPGQALEARGRGLLRGLLVKQDAAGIVARCREKGLLVSLAGGSVVRFVPPLIVTRPQLDEALGILDGVLERAVQQ